MKLSVFYHHIEEASRQRGIPLEELLKQVRSFGIEYVETDMAYITDTQEMKETLDRAGLRTASIYNFYNFGEVPDGTQAFLQVDAAKALGADKVLVIPGLLKGTALEEQEKEKENMLSSLRQVCKYAKTKDITVIIEDFDNDKSPIADSEGMIWFLNRLPELRAAFDTGNFIYMGEDELSAFENLKDRIVHVHCKDRTLKVTEGEEPKITVKGIPIYSSPVGFGCIKIEEILKRLKAMKYDGLLSIEHFGSLDQLGFIEESSRWLSRFLDSAE